MSRRKVVFCERRFLSDFDEKLRIAFSGDFEAFLCFGQFQKFLNKSDLILNIDVDAFSREKDSDRTLSTLWKGHANGTCSLTFNSTTFPDIFNASALLDEQQLNAIYLCCKSKEDCTKVSKRYGIIVLNPDMIRDANHVFNDEGKALPDNNIKGWEFMDTLNHKYPSISINNALILTDNYIVNKNDVIIEKNLIKLLDIILPKDLDNNIVYPITIFSKVDNTTEINRVNRLIEKIKNLRNKYHIKVSIMQVGTDDFHDRAIITNNIWITCGHGFDVFTGSNMQSTTVNVLYPFIQSSNQWVAKAYYNLVDDANRIFKRDTKHNTNYWGDFDLYNRLSQSQKEVISKSALLQSKESLERLGGPRITGYVDVSNYKKRR